jgi:hypothetical protein
VRERGTVWFGIMLECDRATTVVSLTAGCVGGEQICYLPITDGALPRKNMKINLGKRKQIALCRCWSLGCNPMWTCR